MFLYGLICFTLFGSDSVFGFAIEALQDFMTVPELAYYFKTGEKNLVPEYDIVYLPNLSIKEAASLEDTGKDNFEEETVEYSFSAFQRPINLKLKKNDHIISPYFQSNIIEDENVAIALPKPMINCHYIHRDSSSTAALSFCNPQSLQGFLFLENTTLEIHPLTDRLKAIIRTQEPLLEHGEEDLHPHLIKRAITSIHEDAFPILNLPLVEKRASHRPVGGLTLELAMFFDEAAYKIFSPFFANNEVKLQDMLLAYLNGVQALYHHPTLGNTLELVLVRLDLMKKQPAKLRHYEGERGQLLDSFCAYQKSINPQGDSNPNHWDMGLYVSGLDFFAYENGKKSGVTMGLATVGGVCLDKYACVIAELGTVNVFGKPYPSAGFTSVYILAHEMGHNLGMHHDGVGNSCPKEGYVMSPSRGTNGETLWSTCSADVMSKLNWAKCLQDSADRKKHLDHSRFLDSPGQIYTAKKQCEILLRDKDAVMASNQKLSTICYNLHCKTPHRSGFYFAGPALEGTQCGAGQYCFGGECTNKSPPKPVKVIPGGWGPWKEGKCSSGCLEKSKGYQTKRRTCNNPAPVNTDKGCEGSSINFGLCKDDHICSSKRLSVIDYASQKCTEFAKLIPDLDKNGAGLQSPHEEGRVWMGCAIFCRRADSGSYYTPRIELNDLGVSPYFPDGTWCHRENNMNYYCVHHHCLPENFQLSRTTLRDDFQIPQNALPQPIVPINIKDYFSLGPDGKPLQTIIKPEDHQPKEEEWETDDYIIVPGLSERYLQKMFKNGDESENTFD